MRGMLAMMLVGCAYAPRPADLATSDGSPGDGVPADTTTDGIPDDGIPADTVFACPMGYTLRVEGSCHRIVTSPLTWDLAEADCELAGAHLVVIGDTLENSALPADVWIGLSERITAGTFVTVTGVPVVFDGFAVGEPIAGGAACVTTRVDGWHDDNCTESKNYACEFDGRAADPSQF